MKKKVKKYKTEKFIEVHTYEAVNAEGTYFVAFNEIALSAFKHWTKGLALVAGSKTKFTKSKQVISFRKPVKGDYD